MKKYLAGLALLLLCLAGPAAAHARSGYPPPLLYESVNDSDTVALDVIDFESLFDSTSMPAYRCLYIHREAENGDTVFIVNSSTFLRASKLSTNYLTLHCDSILGDTVFSNQLRDTINQSLIFEATVMDGRYPNLIDKNLSVKALLIESTGKILIEAEYEKKFSEYASYIYPSAKYFTKTFIISKPSNFSGYEFLGFEWVETINQD